MRHRTFWAASILPLWVAGFAVGKLHLLVPRPEVFFALGAAATLCVGAAVHYGRDAIRGARAGKPYRN
jgi:hypothetical protein